MDCQQRPFLRGPSDAVARAVLTLVDRNGKPLTSWRYMRSECRSPKHIGPADPRKTLSWSDIRDAIRRIGVPPAKVEGPDYTLVNLRTTFYTQVSPSTAPSSCSASTSTSTSLP